MKNVFSILLLLILSVQLNAQTWNEWFKQNKTQRKYLLNQIVKLQLYLGYVKKGYGIVNAGLSTIGTIKRGDFQLHDLFFSDKKRVKPLIRNSFTVLEIIRAANHVRQFWSSVNDLLSNPSFSLEEKEYILNLKYNLLESLSKDIQSLLDVITSGKLEMSDQERIERIEVLQKKVVNKKLGTIAIGKSLQILLSQKNNDREDIQNLRELFLFPIQP